MAQLVTDFKTLLDAISFLPETKHIGIAAISGFGGSGKSTLARQLADHLPGAAMVQADDFMRNNYHERSDSWDCIDRQRIITEILRPAEEGSEIKYHAFDWATGETKNVKSIGTPSLLILEGIGIIHPDLLPYFDFSIWIDMPPDQAAERGMKRDKEVLHTDNDKLWREIWLLNDLKYYSKYYPYQHVDCVYKPAEEARSDE